MDHILIKKLNDIENTYSELEKKLGDPDVYGNPEELKKVSKSKKSLQETYDLYQSFKLIEKELGKKLKDVFLSFDPVPVAAASIGQVHIAKLKDGKKVAVKIQRPGIDKLFKTDIDMMYLFVYLFQNNRLFLKIVLRC